MSWHYFGVCVCVCVCVCACVGEREGVSVSVCVLAHIYLFVYVLTLDFNSIFICYSICFQIASTITIITAAENLKSAVRNQKRSDSITETPQMTSQQCRNTSWNPRQTVNVQTQAWWTLAFSPYPVMCPRRTPPDLNR